jgi:hypothetical protein
MRPSRGEDRAKTDEDRLDYPSNGFLRQSKHILPPSADNGAMFKYSDHEGGGAHLRRARRSLGDTGHDHGDRVSPLKMVWAGMLAYPETQWVDPTLPS